MDFLTIKNSDPGRVIASVFQLGKEGFTPEVTKAAEIVDMKQPTEEEIANIMGEESATASKVIFVNNMGSDISSVYIRKHVEDEDDSDDDTWGSDLVDGKFTLKDKDKALYYFS